MTHIVYPTTNFKAIEQIKIERGEGIYVYDDKGNQYIEGMAGLWCTALGYGNEELIEATTEQMRKLTYTHMFGGKTHQVAIDLADKLSAMLPMNNATVFFGSSGSDANDSHIKMLRYYFAAIGKPEKRKIISRQRSYHGVTVAAASLTGLPVNQQHFDLPIDALGIIRTDHAHYYRGKQGNETEVEFVDRIVGNLEAQILREGPETIAAFIAEPVTGASGVLVPPAGYFEKVQALLNKYDILMWTDEVITGFGRTGNDFGSATVNIQKPDMMTLAKQLSSAYMPISAAAIRGDMYEAMADQSAAAGAFGHGYTYSGHPVACAVALKTLEIYERDNIFAHAAERGDYLQAQLAQFNDHPMVGEVRGRGLLAAVELVANKITGQEFANGSVGATMVKNCQDNGLILRAVAGNSLAFCPPLIISNEQIDDIISRFADALNKTYTFAQQNNLLLG
ncbi:MAG: aminotransferase [Pseudomonadales bacterium]